MNLANKQKNVFRLRYPTSDCKFSRQASESQQTSELSQLASDYLITSFYGFSLKTRMSENELWKSEKKLLRVDADVRSLNLCLLILKQVSVFFNEECLEEERVNKYSVYIKVNRNSFAYFSESFLDFVVTKIRIRIMYLLT